MPTLTNILTILVLETSLKMQQMSVCGIPLSRWFA